MDRLLSNHDIEDIVGEKIPIVTSVNIMKYNDIDDLFGNYNKCLILYQDSNMNNKISGHWTCICRKLNNIYFFDSYGGFPDSQLKHIPIQYRKQTKQIINKLSKLLYNSQYDYIHYNPYKFQKSQKNINTCGRWCGAFLKLYTDPEIFKKIIDIIKNNLDLDYDQLIVKLTNKYIL